MRQNGKHLVSILGGTRRRAGRTHNEEHRLRSESELAQGESRETTTHEGDIIPIPGQFKVLGQTL